MTTGVAIATGEHRDGNTAHCWLNAEIAR